MKYNPPVGGAANDPYVDGNPSTGTEGSAVPAASIEAPQREIVEVITAAGLSPSATDNTQLYQAIAALIANGTTNTSYGTAAGGTTAYTVTTTPAFTSLTAGQIINLKINATNTGASTLNANSTGAKNIVDIKGNAIDANSLVINRVYELVYTSSGNFLLKAQKQQLLNFAADTGTANTYAIAPNPVLDALVAGMIVELIPTHANTGSSSLNTNGLGAVSILTQAGANLTANTLLTTGTYLLEYNGTNWVLLNPSASVSLVSVKRTVVTASGIYTPSAGMVYADVEILGGGAGSPYGNGTNSVQAGAGAGAFAKKLFNAATIGASQSVTIGAAGVGGTSGSTSGGAGSTSSFGALLSCAGGAATTTVSNPSGGIAAGGLGAAQPSSGDIVNGGQQGGIGFQNGNIFSGYGGSTIYGAGGGPQIHSGSGPSWVGTNGLGYGAGAGGAAGANNGGNGSPGVCIITEFCTQ